MSPTGSVNLRVQVGMSSCLLQSTHVSSFILPFHLQLLGGTQCPGDVDLSGSSLRYTDPHLAGGLGYLQADHGGRSQRDDKEAQCLTITLSLAFGGQRHGAWALGPIGSQGDA